MTATRSHISAITDRSCDINSSDIPNSSRKDCSSRRICACTVTSSAVVGSSAMSNRGCDEIASAIMTRWAIPPENWCG